MLKNIEERWFSLPVTKENIYNFQKLLNAETPQELALFIEANQPDNQHYLFQALAFPLATKTFSYLSLPTQKFLLYALPSEKAARILNELPPDDRTAFFEELPSQIVNQWLKLLSPAERSITLKLLGYPEGSVGRLMTPDYLAIRMEWTVREVLKYVRSHGQDSETINVLYVIDDKGVLIDDIRMREVLLSPLSIKIADLSDHKFITLNVMDREEEAVQVFRKFNRMALPVIDNQGILLGIVTIDDILNVAEKQGTEEIQMVGGTQALDEPYMQTPFLRLMKKRASWLIILFLGELLTASAMGYFEDEIAKAVVLALFLPLIISSGGNSGSQAATLIIRSMALKEISIRDWWKVMQRELLSGVFLGTILGLIGFVRVALWSQFTDIYGPYWLLVAFTIYGSLLGVVLWGTISGSMLPIFLKWMRFDPAVSSAPFIATLVDVTGLIIYFSLAMIILKGTML